MKKFNYADFRDMDYVFCTAAFHPLSMIIRATEAGLKGVFGPSKVASHEGRLIALECSGVKVWHIWEMLPGNDGQLSDLKLHPLSMYLSGGLWSSKVVAIKRNLIYDDPVRRAASVKLAMEMWQSG